MAVACKRDGTGGDCEIAAFAKHHETLIPGCTIYIKYGAKEFPGTDLSVYDDSKKAGSVGEAKGHTHFSGLLKGDYYLYGVGYDSSISMEVRGGIHIKLKKKGETELDVPVTE